MQIRTYKRLIKRNVCSFDAFEVENTERTFKIQLNMKSTQIRTYKYILNTFKIRLEVKST